MTSDSWPPPRCQGLLSLPPGVQCNLHTQDVGWRLEGGGWLATRRDSRHLDSGAELDSQPGLFSLTHGDSPHGDSPHGRAYPSSLAAAWASVLHALGFAIRKFSGLSSVLKLVPVKPKSLHLQRRA